jgi:hypothetical protein
MKKLIRILLCFCGIHFEECRHDGAYWCCNCGILLELEKEIK